MNNKQARGKQKLLKNTRLLIAAIGIIVKILTVAGCGLDSSKGKPETPKPETASSPQIPIAIVSPSANDSSNQDSEVRIESELLDESWIAYRDQFIQADGRVIDREAGDRSTSEAQAYAMLRAVLIDDPITFVKVLEWGERNLGRKVALNHTDQLWAWNWGKDNQGNWGILDANFASDADIDAIAALILAGRRWNRPEYMDLARSKLKDLWQVSTVKIPDGNRYLLPGPKSAFQPKPSTIQLNPSYLATYAFRIFAQVDPDHDWLSLVDSSYQVLEFSAELSAVGLPSDWVVLDIKTGQFKPLLGSSRLKSQYGFDAYRVWWRVFLDVAWFDSPQGKIFLEQHLSYLIELWQTQQRIPAEIDLLGKPLVDYEATSQYAMLYAALSLIEPKVAQEILEQKLMPQYENGFWDHESAYYSQNIVWLGLLPPTIIESRLLQPQ
ncbi:MAG: glycosyl hydrolase [Moorea sp. SIO2B7]|nr:glycosyl hydrolase [Moorena sp. SIO2B7]